MDAHLIESFVWAPKVCFNAYSESKLDTVRKTEPIWKARLTGGTESTLTLGVPTAKEQKLEFGTNETRAFDTKLSPWTEWTTMVKE